MVKNLPAMQGTRIGSLGWEDPLEKGLANHSSILAWRIPWTEEPDRLQYVGSELVVTEQLHYYYISWIYTHTYIYITTIQSSVDGYLVYFPVLAIVNNADVNIGCRWTFSFLWIHIQMWNPGSHGSCIFHFFLYTVFHNSCTNLRSHQQFTWVPFSLQSHQHMWSLVILMEPLWQWGVIFHCVPDLHFPDDWAPFHVPVGNLYVFFRKMSVQVLYHILIRLFVVFYWVVWVLYIFWISVPCQIRDLQIFSLILYIALWLWLWFSHSVVSNSYILFFSLLCRSFLFDDIPL